ncbi:hypothetical protein [Neorhizobium petrolearium]|uniref:hypothetical protein n=1 Tax=Neorhizobium petrolearium TaxID=515361 RepID=UPI003F8181FB
MTEMSPLYRRIIDNMRIGNLSGARVEISDRIAGIRPKEAVATVDTRFFLPLF